MASTRTVLNFNINHLDPGIKSYILAKAGWHCTNKFELECKVVNRFECIIQDGVMHNQPDMKAAYSNNYYIQEIALHHLACDFKYLVLKYLKTKSVIDYEIFYGDYNSLYVHIPYYNYWMNSEKNTTEVLVKPEQDTKDAKDSNFVSFGNSNVNYFVQEESTKYLKGFYFKDEDEKTFLLYRPNTYKVLWNGTHYWNNLNKMWYAYPIHLVLFPEREFVSWSTEKNAWVVQKNYRTTLINLGAKYLKDYNSS